MPRSVLGTVGLALTLAFAIPVAFLGADKLLAGEMFIGGVFLVLALLMVLVEEYVTTPMDVPEKIAGETIGRIVTDSDEETEQK